MFVAHVVTLVLLAAGIHWQFVVIGDARLESMRRRHTAQARWGYEQA